MTPISIPHRALTVLTTAVLLTGSLALTPAAQAQTTSTAPSAVPDSVAAELAAAGAGSAIAGSAAVGSATVGPAIGFDIDVAAAAALAADLHGESAFRDAALATLPADRAADVRAVISALTNPIQAPDYSDPSTHIVVLGGGLLGDGSVPPGVELRLMAALEQAEQHPDVPVLVTGGPVPGTAFTEAVSMRQWLIDHGLSADRILVEGQSWTTVSNASFTQRVIPEATSLVIATTPSHLRRGIADFTAVFGAGVTITGIAAEDPTPWDEDLQLQKAYRDVIVWYLLPRFGFEEGLPPLSGPGINGSVRVP